MNKVQLLFGIHCHQPVGNFDSVCDEIYRSSYRPFLDAVQKHPELRLTLHYSGGLMEWIEEHHPDWFDLVRCLAAAGQVELLGGGFYEPILAMIPEPDRFAQVDRLSAYLGDKFGQRPRGMWLAERVWDSAIVKSIHQSGIQYVLVDDYHLICSGVDQEQLRGYYLTEEEGCPVAVFPIDTTLRYLTPFQPPERTFDYLRQLAESGDGACAIVVDDGEKYGGWPGTYDWVYKQGWLEQFFSLLEQNRDWVETKTFSEILAGQRPLGRIYLPTASYFEMGQWSLPATRAAQFAEAHRELEENGRLDKFRPFIRGGIWKNFLVKYPESNNMQKKMLYLSRRSKTVPVGTARDQAHDWLYRAQTNDAYWHGIFGGLYLPHLRHAIYRFLIACEQACDAGQAKTALTIEEIDLNLDGMNELLVSGPACTCVLTPAGGGQMYELSIKELKTNIFNTLSRRFEYYHAGAVDMCPSSPEVDGIPSIHHRDGPGDGTWDRKLLYDRYDRQSFIDHFLPDGISLGEFVAGQYEETPDFTKGDYLYRREGNKVVLERGCGLMVEGEEQRVNIRKTFSFSAGTCSVGVTYEFTNNGTRVVGGLFGTELNFAMPAGGSDWGYYLLNDERPDPGSLINWGDSQAIGRVCLVDKAMGGTVSLSWETPVRVWRWPVETVSQSERGWEKTYQSSMVMPLWPLVLAPGDTRQFRIQLSVQRCN